jgi:hypothetical protein
MTAIVRTTGANKISRLISGAAHPLLADMAIHIASAVLSFCAAIRFAFCALR